MSSDMRWSIVAFGLVAACAPSMEEVKHAHEAAYQTDFPAVWAAVSAEMHTRYEPLQIKVEDPVHGVIVSEWKLVDVSQEQTEGESSMKKNTSASTVRQGTFMRMMVKISAGPPYRIAVDAEAAEFRPNLSMVIPYKHGAADEPHFVQPRIDKMYVDVYNRLKKVAVKPGKGEAPAPQTPLDSDSAPAVAPPAPAKAPAPTPPGAPPIQVAPPNNPQQ